MRDDDPRGRRIAIVSDALVNGEADLLGLLAPGGWGAMQLPPPALRGDAAAAWLEGLFDQAAEFRRHRYLVVAVIAADEPAAAAVRALGVPVLELADPPGELEAFLAASAVS